MTALERDPLGRSAKDKGSKLDAGKNQLGLVLCDFAKAIEVVGDVGTYGANKYTPHGWTTVPNGHARYTDAMLRHFFREAQGELQDPDTKILHAGHLAWNALARLEFTLRRLDLP